MKNIINPNNYRLKYKLYYNIDFDRKYVIHHIDGNHNNNEISNLILLPIDLHSKYHTYRDAFERETENGMCFDLSAGGFMVFGHNLLYLNPLIDIMNKLQVWVNYKDAADHGYSCYPMFRRFWDENKNK